ncbi:hypothetical protein DKX38_029669 [Salix brachista]|uniref:CCHC-type domain-containing protein n=1 Tax=Salix brachista TaxID=2182728 RepID=A0A5N5J0A7_9ROSI|nr:hypothetical protein DKX38_029669 [Salix brachista]
MPPRRRVPNRIPVEEANERDRMAQLEQQMAIITEQLATLLANQNPFHGLNPNAGGAEDESDEENEPQIEIPQLRRQAPERDDNRRWEYCGGLRAQIMEVVNLFDPITVSEAHQRALQIEKSISRRGTGGLLAQGSSGVTGKFGSNNSSSSNRSAIMGSNNGTPAILSTPNQQPRVAGGFKCFNCGEVGHRQSDCKRLGKRTLFTETNEEHNEDTIITGDPIFDEDEEVMEDWVEGDVGPLLMVRPIYDEAAKTVTEKNNVLITGELEDQQLMTNGTITDHGTTMVVQRTCLAPRADESDWLRNNVFHSTCTILGKVCRFIIDGGSCENFVSAEVVKKLEIKTSQNTKPYKLAWLQKGGEVTVSQRALISFSIGKHYKDQVWCDIVRMDACHLLLGRPWQYDRKVRHDGFKNTYSFLYDKVNIVLLPSKPRDKPTVNEDSNLLSFAELEVEMEDAHTVYLLLNKEVEAKVEDIHAQVYANLEKTVGKYKLAADKKRRHVEFDVGDFVWAILTKDRFPVGEYNKLAAKKIGPLEVLGKINPNAYRLRLPSHIRTADVFNVKHLIPYSDDSSQEDTDYTSRTTFLHPGGDDAASSLALEYMERMDRSKTGK